MQWVRRSRRGKEQRPWGVEMRFLGVLEMSRGWRFDVMHVPGALNDATDGISRCDQSVVRANLARTPPRILHISGMFGSWGRTGSTLMYLRVGFALVRSAIAPSNERAYRGVNCLGESSLHVLCVILADVDDQPRFLYYILADIRLNV